MKRETNFKDGERGYIIYTKLRGKGKRETRFKRGEKGDLIYTRKSGWSAESSRINKISRERSSNREKKCEGRAEAAD